METATLTIPCPKCKSKIIINQRWTPGGMNDYGSFKIECGKCSHKFVAEIGRDVNDSDIISGGKILERLVEA